MPSRDALRLMLVSDGRGDPDRLASIATAAFEHGATMLQVREPRWDREATGAFVARLAPAARANGAHIVVNGMAIPGADGVHLPSRFLGTAAAAAAARTFCGFAAHDAGELEQAASAGACYAALAPVWPTPCKPDVAPIGLDRARAWTRVAGIPVLWLGGITVETAPNLGREPCAGVAVRSAICSADDPGAATAALRTALGG